MYDDEHDETHALVPAAALRGRANGIEVCVTAGPDAGATATIGPEGLLVGTSPAAGLRLSDPTVSRRHVTLSPRPDGVRAVDHGSRNGTRVGSVGVRDADLPAHATLVLGGSTLVVRPLAAAAQTTAAPPPTPVRASLGRIHGASAAMQWLYGRIEKLAQSTLTVLIEGETGTGKELVAETLHELSPRAGRPFVVFDCTTVAPTLLESELFGHEKGSFTGATSTARGLLDAAAGGTLFVDEIGELDLALQAKLLRAIERGEYRAVGTTSTRRSDARIVAASRRDLDAEVTAGRFRDDLFHRLAVGRVAVPPLREREGDVELLARRFADEFAPGVPLPDAVVARLVPSRWPGNVRQLRNAVARYVALGEVDDAEATRPRPASNSALVSLERVIAEGAPYTLARAHALAAFDRAYVEALLSQHGGNVSQAARAAGIGRRYFHVLKARVERE